MNKLNYAATRGWKLIHTAEWSRGKDVNSTEEGKRDHFNEVMAAIMLSRALCRRDRGVGGFLAAWECIAMCF